MSHPLVRFLLLLLTAFLVLKLLQGWLGSGVLLLIVVSGGLLAAAVYMLRYQRGVLAVVYRHAAGRILIDGICRLTASQPPVEADDKTPLDPRLMLRETRDFEWAERKLRAHVIGHDTQIRSLLQSLMERTLVRAKSPRASGLPPLGAYLLIGPEGIGKRHLAEQLARLMFREGTFTTYNLADYSTTALPSLFGTETQQGELIRTMRRWPQGIVLLENLDRSDHAFQSALLSLLRTGNWLDPRSRNVVSFKHAVIIATVAAALPGLSEAPGNESPETWQEQIQERLAADFGLHPILLGSLHWIGSMQRPNSLDTARVVALLMQAECRRYGLEIDYVDPEILADEVAHYRESLGFELARARLAHRLKSPIVAAKRHDHPRVIVTSAN
jgi:hypothetical protein